MVVQRVLHFKATTKLLFNSESNEHAGITGYYGTKTYARMGLQRGENGKLLLVLEECRYGKKSVLKVTGDINTIRFICV